MRDDLKDRIMSWKKDLGFRIFSVVILAGVTQVIKDISDTHVRLENLLLDEEAVNIYGRI